MLARALPARNSEEFEKWQLLPDSPTSSRLPGRDARLKPVTLGDVKLRAPRPVYCALDNSRLREAGVPMPTWQDALARYLGPRG
jgi:dTDP-4-dehydrorhamnose reductase